jgi:hypothetical protein
MAGFRPINYCDPFHRILPLPALFGTPFACAAATVNKESMAPTGHNAILVLIWLKNNTAPQAFHFVTAEILAMALIAYNCTSASVALCAPRELTMSG